MPGLRRMCEAGRFYPASAEELRRWFDLLASGNTSECGKERIRALILPHAGYVFSLATAFAALGCATNVRCERIVILSPNHTVCLRGAVMGDYSEWETPFGPMPVDFAAQSALSAAVPIRNDALVHEHAIEVQLPLLRYFFGATPIVPLTVGELTATAAETLATALRPLFRPGTLFLVSSDFTHYGERFGYAPLSDLDADAALRQIDLPAARLAAARDLNGFEQYLERTETTICGANPIRVLLRVMRETPEITGRLAAYDTSCAASGDEEEGVGYASLVFAES